MTHPPHHITTTPPPPPPDFLKYIYPKLFETQIAARHHLPLATIYIITHTGQRIPLQVLVVDEIATPLQIPLCQHVHEMSHLKDLTVAYPITAQEDFCISLRLIGADHYWDIVEDQMICGQGPTAVA